jgi:hypothetical protein
MCHSASRVLCRLEAQRQAIHAVAQASGLRAIIEDVTQVALAALAPHLSAGHEGDGVVWHLSHSTCSTRGKYYEHTRYQPTASWQRCLSRVNLGVASYHRTVHLTMYVTWQPQGPAQHTGS